MTSITKTVTDPALGERALAVHPPITTGGDTADFDAQGWGRRTRYVAGRSVTDRALQTDQRHVEGHIPTAGQRLAPGVVVGLEVTIEGTRSEPILHIAPGIGVCLSGEDVRVTHPVEIPAGVLWVTSDGDDEPQRLADLLASDLASARALIVQLRPVVVERTGVDDADDPCEVDPEAIAFTDEQLVDGCRVRLYALELEPGLGGASFRNEVAYAVFQIEAQLGIEQLPWQAGGLPIALLGFPAGIGVAPFVDIHAAARRGGHANPRQPRVQAAGTHALWQARFEQFIAQVADSDIEQLKTNGLGSQFRWLPPVGMLPPGTIDVRGDIGEPDFPLPQPTIFPEEFVLEAVPVEIEALDEYLRASVALAPFDTLHQEQVQVLVPVPQRHFDPDLLIVEDETPDEFRDAIERFLLVLNHRLGRRFFVRAAERHVARALHGRDLVVAAEPTAVTGEVQAFFPVDQVLVDAGLPVPPPETIVGAEVTPRIIALITQMYNAVGGPANQSPINPLSAVLRAAALYHGAEPPDVDDLQQNSPDELVDFFIERRFGGKGLVGFTNFCVRQLVLASERITLAFERMQAELHRIRQYLSGTQVADQLAASPVISAVAVRDRSAQKPLQLTAFAAVLRDKGDVEVPIPDPDDKVIATVPTQGIATGGRAIASSVLFNRNLLQRLESSPPSFDASANADRATREALRAVLYIHDDLGLSLDGIVFPERLFNRGEIEGLPDEAPITIEIVRGEIERWLTKGEWKHEFDEDQGQSSEADFFGNAVRRLEEMVAVLRIAEARLTAYEAVVDLMRDEIDGLRAIETAIAGRLAELQDEIEELRHDVRVARALEREEMARAVRVNQRRAQVIAEHVPFLVFRRPRSVEAVRVPPSVPLETAADPDIVPDCLDEQIVPPEQLTAMLDLIRDLPVNRLKIGPGIVQQFDRYPQLLALADFVRHSAVTAPPVFYDPFAGELFSDKTGVALRARYSAHLAVNERLRAARGQRVSTTAYRSHSWSRLQAFVQDNATIGDVLNAPRGDLRRIQPLAKELDNLSRVAACLYEQFKAVSPLVRLAWVRQVSEEDENVVRLDDLSVLPSWELVDRIHRRDLQSLIDWLFARFNPEHGDGIAYVSDLVRVALLLSGHAPVQRVLDAVVVAPRPVSTGGIVRLQIDPARVRVGMHVELFADATRKTTVGAGIVDDLAEGVVAVKLVSTVGGTVRPTHALVSDPTMGPTVQLAGGLQQSIGFASKLS